MKTQEVFLNGKKIEVVTEIDEDLIEIVLNDNFENLALEDTANLTDVVNEVENRANE